MKAGSLKTESARFGSLSGDTYFCQIIALLSVFIRVHPWLKIDLLNGYLYRPPHYETHLPTLARSSDTMRRVTTALRASAQCAGLGTAGLSHA
jgi:hypothetical protein